MKIKMIYEHQYDLTARENGYSREEAEEKLKQFKLIRFVNLFSFIFFLIFIPLYLLSASISYKNLIIFLPVMYITLLSLFVMAEVFLRSIVLGIKDGLEKIGKL
ncbi:MAG: hypothetical protein KJ886_04860 [Candidatus Thermoplasmatota archaeon]|nr:hypothetical protein [Candidatus Thermoplasmatota archaeon]